ncbi:uncharacterized protein LOC117651983 [Thrips palmi]|uniref:Uncharacterized protein LOC117651983 n=1 Tax=Thrips palmi TaxID=161013 RepID=A0A6P9A5I9_THRPL|nr:uncharacterized protein LOC117651983 [Thrips palmi]
MRATGFWRRVAAYDDERPSTLSAAAVSLAQRVYFNLNVVTNVVFLGAKLMHSALDTDSIRNVTENLSDVLCIAFSLLQLLVLYETEDRLKALLRRGFGRFYLSSGPLYDETILTSTAPSLCLSRTPWFEGDTPTGLLRVLQAETLADGGWSAEERARVEACVVQGVKHHQAVISLAEELCQVLAPFLTVQLSTIVFLICVALFQVSINPADAGNVRFIMLATTVVIEAFILCWMGTGLSDEATEVQTGLECGDWYLQGAAVAYTVKFALMRAQKPPHVVVANNALLGLPLFLELIRSSYSLLAFLQKRATSTTEVE